MNSNSLLRYPFLRLLASLATGIACGQALPQAWPPTVTVCAALLLFTVYLLCRRHLPSIFGLFTAAFFILLGHQLMSRHIAHTLYPFPPDAATWQVKLTSQPEEKAKSLLLEATLEGVSRNDSLLTARHPTSLLLYFPKDSTAHSLRRGDRLLIHARLAMPTPNGNPCEFNYPRYLLHKGIGGTGYVPLHRWKVIAHDSTRSLTQQAADYRQRVVAHYRRLGFSGDELAVLSALTVGEKSELSEEISETYSATGAAHVLALSGLHIGLLYALFNYLLTPLWRRQRNLKPLCTLAIVAVMWLFALLTGLSPSVVRAVSMFSLLSVASLRSERTLTPNSLAATAFLMLLIHPAWLFDVGFQLSFCAVAGILLLKPGLDRLWRPRHPLLLKLRDLLTVSLAAQAAVAPLLMLYFARFSVHFLLTNLWVIPLVTLIMYAALLMLLLSPFPGLQALFAPVVELLIRFQHTGLRHIEALPASTIDRISLHPAEAAFLLAIILLLAGYLNHRSHLRLSILLGSLLLFSAVHCAYLHHCRPRAAIAFYNYRSCPAVHLMTDSRHSWLVCADSTMTAVSGLKRSLASYWNRMKLAEPQLAGPGHPLIAQDTPGLCMLFYGGKRIGLLSGNYRPQVEVPRRYTVDYLYLSEGFRGNMQQLTRHLHINQVVLDGSLPAYLRQRLGNECRQLGIPCHDLSAGGYLQALL